MPFLHVTTNIEGRKDDDLLVRKTGRSVYPTILFLTAEGETLQSLDRAVLSGAISTGRLTMASFEKKLHACERYVALRPQVAAGDVSARVCLAVRALEIGKIDVADFARAVAGVELTPERAKRIALVRANATCESLVAKMRSAGMAPDAEKEATREFLKLYEAGTHPDSDSADIYWWVIGTHAKSTRNAAMIERSIEGLRASDPSRFGQLIGELEEVLRALK